MRFHSWQMDDVLTNKVVRDKDAFRINMVQRQHFCLRLVWDPLHLFRTKVKESWNVVMFKNRQIAIQIFAFEGIGQHGLVLDTNQVIKPSLVES